MTPSTPTIFFAGGGTGGHIFPALAIAQQVLVQSPRTRCEFLVSQRPLDSKILSDQQLAGSAVTFHAIPAQPVGLHPKALYKFLTNWGFAVRTARAHLQRAESQGPVVVVATGGFVAAPVAQAARVEGVPLVMVNLDAIPGKANRWIGKHAAHRATALAIAGHVRLPRKDQPWTSIRPIVRETIRSSASIETARAHFGLAPHVPTLLITGGSQGAGSMNALMTHLLEQRLEQPEAIDPTFKTSLQGWQVLHQAGAQADLAALKASYARAQVRAHVTAFIDRMDFAWRAADVALCRAGAGNVSEVWATQTPAIFLPYPYHKDDHQVWNARPLVNARCAQLAIDRIDPKATWQELDAPLSLLLRSKQERDAMRASLEALGPADGAATIAQTALAFVKNR